ncbi:tRNA-dihydrouridine synthase [Longilinea arvoryzae]|uniref:tRNA-dihydrouridine synthase n=1 Tax=Longilinea arvoryzae TaxID=360412 RepID=A0A0S7BLE1_9CHLR|nr:tRNA-dihydrouridine synthase family protein [Longilinea arvoryzae]GAP14795.1 tRNA-dihydrouridine synthase [Longilinea arvoryzae]
MTLLERTAENKTAFTIRDIPVHGDLVLSPMDGVSDAPFRELTRSLGSALSYTEFINAIDILNGYPYLEEHLYFSEQERPVVYQIFDDDPERLVKAAHRLRERCPDIIDVNMGCSARCVSGRGAGAALLRTPEKIARIFSTLTRELDIPITGKIRLGWDATSRNYLEIAHIIEDNGGALIAVHARTKEQGYNGEVDWDAIGEIKQAIRIPVLGNGDVKTVADIERIQAQTGCDGVMIGRAAIGNPWIFSRLERNQVPPALVRTTLRRHLDANIEFYGVDRGLTLFRKHLKRYLAPYDVPRSVLGAMLTSTDPAMVWSLLDQILPG